jgi:hypothetical protein
MQFAAALIEYLITGIVASTWVVALINHYTSLPLQEIQNYKEIFVVAYFPIAYILGIYIDVTSSFLIRRSKEIYGLVSGYKLISPIHTSHLKNTDGMLRRDAGSPRSGVYRE